MTVEAKFEPYVAQSKAPVNEGGNGETSFAGSIKRDNPWFVNAYLMSQNNASTQPDLSSMGRFTDTAALTITAKASAVRPPPPFVSSYGHNTINAQNCVEALSGPIVVCLSVAYTGPMIVKFRLGVIPFLYTSGKAILWTNLKGIAEEPVWRSAKQ